MESTPEHHLHQAIKLAQQAAAQMKKAAKLAENAALTWQQALNLLNPQDHPELAQPIQMSVAPKRPRKQALKSETARLIENAPMRNVPRLTPAPSPTESAASAPAEHGWEEGDDWWKPRQPAPPAES